ncbi:MAG: acyl-CoA dehydrogenase [Candidatus Chloroheliales bacterium]|nr:MAG: acyl-CoA dehydrogenase [Chloroflexota bacterium]
MNLELTEEQQMLQQMAREFAEEKLRPVAAECDEQQRMPSEQMKEMADLGFFGLLIPEQYGGIGVDTLSYVLILEEINKVMPAVGTVTSVHNSLVSTAIARGGNEEQKQAYLPRLANGELLGAYALSEPHAGSDPASMRTAAYPDGDDYVLNGTKSWISSGKSGGLYLVFAVTDKEVKPSRGISAFIVEKETPGLSIGKKEEKMGLRASDTTQLIFQDCRVPVASMVGAEGSGLKLALSLLDGGRIGIAAQALGIAEAALEEATWYAMGREQFGHPISDYQAIQFMLADMATEIEAARLLIYRAAVEKDKRERVTKEASMAKLYASELATRCADKALQIHGGYGYVKDYAIERIYRDARITRIYEGTSEVQRMVIAGQLLRGD